MSRARAVTGGFWGQIVEKNMGVEGRSSPRRTRLATSQSGTRRSGSSKRRIEKKGGSGRRRKEPEFDIPDFGVDRMGSLGEDYYEYLDDYGEDLGNLDMVDEQDFVEKPLDNMEAHRLTASTLRALQGRKKSKRRPSATFARRLGEPAAMDRQDSQEGL